MKDFETFYRYNFTHKRDLINWDAESLVRRSWDLLAEEVINLNNKINQLEEELNELSRTDI